MRHGLILGMTAVLVGGCVIPFTGIRWNHSPSMPQGIWLETAKRKPTRGDIIIACLPPEGTEQRYLDPGACPSGLEPVLKPIAAIAGDLVVVTGDGVSVNGTFLQDTAPMRQDGAGRPLLHHVGSSAVKDGFVWLIVQKPDSFDSRYFGPIPTATVQGLATPLLVWR